MEVAGTTQIGVIDDGAGIAGGPGGLVVGDEGGDALAGQPADLDGAIKEMIKVKKPVLFDCVVEKHENCLPMIPSGKPHNEMILPDFKGDVGNVIDAKGRELV